MTDCMTNNWRRFLFMRNGVISLRFGLIDTSFSSINGTPASMSTASNIYIYIFLSPFGGFR
jgi:hypothetical protein